MALHVTQPVDLDVNFSKLLDAFPVGKKFSQFDVTTELQVKPYEARTYLSELAVALASCPEGVQLVVTRGAHGGHRFVDA